MKTSWKPQAKYATVICMKPRWRVAARRAWRRLVGEASGCASRAGATSRRSSVSSVMTQRDADEREQAGAPSEGADHRLPERREHHGAERAGGRDQAHALAALLRRRCARHHADQHAEPGSRDAQAEEEARGVEGRCVARKHHHQQTEGINERGGEHHRPRALAIGGGADERLRQPPDDVLQSERKAEGRRRYADLQRHRAHEKPKAVAHAHARGK